MTGRCAQRRRWSRLRACTARGLAVAGLAGGAWLLGAGLATAAPDAPRLTPVPAVSVATPDSNATTAADEESDPSASAVTAASADTASAGVGSTHDESTSTHDAGRQLGVAELATDITSDVHAQLRPIREPELTNPDETSPTEPDADAPRPADRVPDAALGDLPRSGHAEQARPSAPRISDPVIAPPPALAAEPATVDSEHFSEDTGTDHAPREHSAPAKRAPDEHRHPPTSTPHQVPPISAPAAPTATATAAPTGPGHGLRWMHAILPTQPCLPGPVRAAGGHVETVTLRGIALIEPSASPD